MNEINTGVLVGRQPGENIIKKMSKACRISKDSDVEMGNGLEFAPGDRSPYSQHGLTNFAWPRDS